MSRRQQVNDLMDKIESEIKDRDFGLRFCLENTLCGLTWNQPLRDALRRVIGNVFETLQKRGPDGEEWWDTDGVAIENDLNLIRQYFPEPISKRVPGRPPQKDPLHVEKGGKRADTRC